jgi:hypothetical protein
VLKWSGCEAQPWPPLRTAGFKEVMLHSLVDGASVLEKSATSVFKIESVDFSKALVLSIKLLRVLFQDTIILLLTTVIHQSLFKNTWNS